MGAVLKDIYANRKLAVSFELFPPKSDAGVDGLFQHLDVLMAFQPDYVTCTYGAGGSTRARTLEVLEKILAKYPGVPVASHLTCVGATQDDLAAYVAQAVEIGVGNIVALRGDPPKGETEFQAVEGGLRYGSELVAFLRGIQPALGIAVGGYPETHIEAVSPEADLDFLKQKVDAGADAVITQLFYDNEDFLRWRDKCAAAGITVPIVPGMLPVISLGQVQRLTSMCGSKLPAKLLQRLEAQAGDEAGQLDVGAYHCARQVEELLDEGIPGVHFYVLNKSPSTSLVCRALGLQQR
ncbi:MAG: methylenetetrahydrofolate reductase [NAD(P)H] [Candidatus Hydrogenedens sp.]|nr:methylenetetrahydrofolate reductase [NAD(P)H] [Candidatus Hydrogenedens sp.]